MWQETCSLTLALILRRTSSEMPSVCCSASASASEAALGHADRKILPGAILSVASARSLALRTCSSDRSTAPLGVLRGGSSVPAGQHAT